MCGIAGIIGLESEAAKQKVSSMTGVMGHRGPDAQGVNAGDGFAFGHRRLSIIDLGHGADQPFLDHSGRFVIVFNGEIYNYMEVRAVLSYPWKTHSDTEVILAAYIEWGKDCLKKLNGMFAFAIMDKQTGETFMARDRLGVKPFYYACGKDGLFVFASEIRSILASGLVERKLDKRSVTDYLMNMTVKTPYTMIRGVMQLKPGHCAVMKNGKLEISEYWSMVADTEGGKREEHSDIVAKVRRMFEESVQSRMVADVKVGAFLSGGIDSSAVVAGMARCSKTPVETFSIVFNDKEFDESDYSRKIAAKYKTKHTEFLLEPTELIGKLPDYIRSMDSPTVDGINTFIVSGLVANTGIKVVLTGIGGDELFAGYSGFQRWKKFSRFGFLFRLPLMEQLVNWATRFRNDRKMLKFAEMFKKKSLSLEAFYTNGRQLFLKDEISKLIPDPADEYPYWTDLNSAKLGRYPVYSRYSVAELTSYTLDVLMKDTDQMSMAWSLEVREPFFDYKLVEYVLGVADKDKYKKGTPKSLFVEAMGDLLPEEIVYRPKKGFTFPWKNWLRNELKPYCEDSIRSLSKRNIFREEGLNELWTSFAKDRNGITWMHIWSLVILEQWIRENNIES